MCHQAASLCSRQAGLAEVQPKMASREKNREHPCSATLCSCSPCHVHCAGTLGTFTLACLSMVCGRLHRRGTRLEAYHFGTSFDEGPSEPKRVRSDNVELSRL